MKTILGALMIAAAVGPLVIGFITVVSFAGNKNKSVAERTEICRNPKMLIASILLLLLVPGMFIYSVFSHAIPEGEYTVNANYRVYGSYDVYSNGTYHEEEYEHSGTAPITIEINHDVDYEDYETSWGQSGTKTRYYTTAYLSSIKLDCFGNRWFYLDDEVDSNSTCHFEIENDGIEYDLTITIGELSDKTLGYTMEDRVNEITAWNVIWRIILMLLCVVGIVGYIAANRIYYQEQGL